MLKKKFIKKVSLIILSILIITIIKIYPTDDSYVSYNYETNEGVIYLLDENNYLAMVDIIYDSNNTEDIIYEVISLLTKSNNNSKLRSGFYPIIPENTKLISCNIENNNAILNFSKDILDIDASLEDKMIESIVFSITSIDNINSVTIKVENTLLEHTPNSNKSLPEKIDRSININKVYDINSLDNIVSTIIYYKASSQDYDYYIPVTKYINSDKEKIEIIIEELTSSNTYNSNIINFMNEETELINYEILDKSLLLNFTDTILGDIVSDNMIEEITYSINLSIKENYDNIDTVMYYINGSIYDTYFLLLG